MPEPTALLENNIQQAEHELTEAEKNALLEATHLVHNSNYSYDAQKKGMFEIASVGNKALEFVRGKLSQFQYSRLVDLLAEPKDLDLIFDELKRSTKNFDGSASSHFIDVLRRIIYKIRSEHSEDPRLMETFQRLKELHSGEIPNEVTRQDIYLPMALCGTADAREYIEAEIAKGNVGIDQANKLRRYLDSVDDIEQYVIRMDSLIADILKKTSEEKNPEHLEYTNEVLKDYQGIKNFINPEIKNLKETKNNPKYSEFNSKNEGKPPDHSHPSVEVQEQKHIFRTPIDSEEAPDTVELEDINEGEEVDPEVYVNFFTEMERLAEENPDLESLISAMEKKLGIETEAQRVLEAALVIDWEFLCTGIVGEYGSLERLFGDNEWGPIG